MEKPKPRTQREILREKRKRKDVKYVTIYNRSSKNSVPIQLKSPPGVDWFLGEQTTWLHKNQRAKFPANRLYAEQVVNHEKAGRIAIVSGREHLGLSSK